MTVKLRGALPRREDFNGLTVLTGANVQPGQPVVAVVVLDVASVTTYADRQDVIVQVREIEVVSGLECASVDYILCRTREARTGAAPLPFEDEGGEA